MLSPLDLSNTLKIKKMLAPKKARSKTIHTNAPILKNAWALPLFKAVEFVPKTIQAATRTDITYVSCEMCSYHLGLESLDLLPLKTCTYATFVILTSIGSAY